MNYVSERSARALPQVAAPAATPDASLGARLGVSDPQILVLGAALALVLLDLMLFLSGAIRIG